VAKPTRFDQAMIDDYLARGYWDRVCIADILEQNARNYPDKEAIVDSEKRLTWSELNRRVDRVVLGLLELGIKRDQAIVAQIPNSTTAVIYLLACQKAGVLSCFSPMTFRHKEMSHILETLKAVGVVTPWKYRNFDYFKMVKEIARYLPHLRHFFVIDNEMPQGGSSFQSLLCPSLGEQKAEEVLKEHAFGPFEVSVILQSSGTTGMPKCIEHTGASCKMTGRGIVQRGRLTEEDVFGIIAPLSGGPGIQNFWGGLQLGAKICFIEHFSPDEALHLIQRERVTYLAAVPTQMIRILRECDLSQYDLRSLRIVRTGASAFGASIAWETEERMKCKVLIAGGSQETYSFAQTSVDDPPEKRLSTIGKPFPGNEIKIVDENEEEVPTGEIGQLFVRGAATSSGYFGNVEATRTAWGEIGKEGWYRTGDLATLDELGYLILVGRKKDMILRGGQNIYPKEIESLLLSHPKIKDALVVGIPDQIMGERVCACVTLAGKDDFTFDEMISYLKVKGLAVHKLPERIEVFEQLPTLVDGQKVDKKSVIDRIVNKSKDESQKPGKVPV